MYFRYIFCCQKEVFFENQYDQIKELQNGKDSLVFRVITKQAIAAIALASKETFLKSWKFFRDNSGILNVQFYNKIHGLLLFKFPQTNL